MEEQMALVVPLNIETGIILLTVVALIVGATAASCMKAGRRSESASVATVCALMDKVAALVVENTALKRQNAELREKMERYRAQLLEHADTVLGRKEHDHD